MSKVWKVGASSKSLNIERVEYLHVDENYPGGRYTTDKAQAEEWARILCSEINVDPNSGATDYEPVVWEDDLPEN